MTKVLDNFRIGKYEDPTFFYKFDLDDEKKVKNIILERWIFAQVLCIIWTMCYL